MEKLFGTDGIRGIVGKPPMTSEMVIKIGAVIGEPFGKNTPGILIGRDSRRSSSLLEDALKCSILEI